MFGFYFLRNCEKIESNTNHFCVLSFSLRLNRLLIKLEEEIKIKTHLAKASTNQLHNNLLPETASFDRNEISGRKRTDEKKKNQTYLSVKL